MMEYKYGSYGVQMYGGFLVEDGVLADFPLVGSSLKQSSKFCGVFSRNKGCLNGHFHNGKDIPHGVLGQQSLDGKIQGAMALIFVRAYRCTDPLCPECCLHWAKLQTGRAMRRFARFSDGFPEYELRHVTISVAKYDFDLGFREMRKKALDMVQAIGVVGGICMYHPKRYSKRLNCWYYSPHFHVLGFVKGGWVSGRMVKEVHEVTEYVLKNLGKRRSVYNTLMYQLSHAGVPTGKQHAVVWFGECNNRKLKAIVSDVKLESEPKGCPVCGEKLLHVCRVAKSVSFDYRAFEDNFVLDSMFNWVVVERKVRRKRSDEDVSDRENDEWDKYNCSDR